MNSEQLVLKLRDAVLQGEPSLRERFTIRKFAMAIGQDYKNVRWNINSQFGSLSFFLDKTGLKKLHSFRYNNPLISQEWHPTKNNTVAPSDVTSGSNKNYWWKCSKGHEWEASPKNRASGNGCPRCSGRIATTDNCLAFTNPNLTKEWHPAKNGDLTPENTTPRSNRMIWWKCLKKGHEWQSTVSSRAAGCGCPICSGQKTSIENCLATLNPQLSKEWHPTKNDNLTPYDVTLGSRRVKIWWKCSKGHEWATEVKNRTSGSGCPFCSGNQVSIENCLATLNPQLAKEWNLTKNGNLTPHDVTISSGRNVWWKCLNNHEWQSRVYDRSTGGGCPVCSKRLITEDNCLAVTNPRLVLEWHPTKNELTPFTVVSGGHAKVWWKCQKGHEWKAAIYSRSKGHGCPFCADIKKSNLK